MIRHMKIRLVPILLGSGERLFDHMGDNLRGLELERTLPSKNAIHLKLARPR